MMQLTDIQQFLGMSLFNGASDVAGLLIFGVVLYLILQVTHDTMTMVIIMIPVLLILTIMGIVSATVLFLMIIAMVIIIALNTSTSLFGA